MSTIKIVNLRKEFKGNVAIEQLNFEFASSQVTCLLGPSGCGKTTLLRMIAGLETPTSGDIYFGDERVTDLSPRRRNIGMVFQYPVVYRGISVYRNIELPLLSEKLPAAERKRRISNVIEMLGLQDSAHKDITQLDNAARQKVAVARAVARQPKIILFDEPITNVDTSSKLVLKRALKELTQQLKQTIVYVTHDQTEAMTLADRIVLMKDGDIVQCDAPRSLYLQPEDTFGGWFLGNPGMDFFAAQCDARIDTGHVRLRSPFLAEPILLEGPAHAGELTVGIRPEHVKVSHTPSPRAVAARLVDKSITVGGQYLLTVEVQGERLKAKVEHQTGKSADETVWIELPIERLMVFDAAGERIHHPLAAIANGSERRVD
ncbi:ABC transporter ATP-binding protein [Paenibacillus sp. CECT 9249]|uniref:ABC transporter ATP-binding protein n=1 Tax=unclassified Paenibacillus TaxID=185978 RepID=UPI001C125F2E|nr:ABC transporter ATP-binding protein [Paenibacillus sp. CECT 9249]MBU5444184.1 ABC transporter ATP-binding protein [Paenibacillus sp. MSJ-34]CAH0122538.1 Oligosaccharides import ATP-binding protein MsmX [Paenibacillus sp. CECT 9249]